MKLRPIKSTSKLAWWLIYLLSYLLPLISLNIFIFISHNYAPTKEPALLIFGLFLGLIGPIFVVWQTKLHWLLKIVASILTIIAGYIFAVGLSTKKYPEDEVTTSKGVIVYAKSANTPLEPPR